MSIPLIDLSQFDSPFNKQNLAKQIYQACHEIGFMYVQNSLISTAKIEQIFQESQSFFNLPLTVKQQLAWSDYHSNIGYVEWERESLNPHQPGDLKEAFNIGNYRLIDTALNLFSPITNPVIFEFYHTCTELANTILKAFALALELPEDFFTSRHNQQNHTLRLLHYPPLQTSPKPGQMRAGEHSDYGSLTLLFQDQIEGLEVQKNSGEWIKVPAIPGTVVVNIGDLMQRWTNHIFCSTKHRVTIPDDYKITKSRYSIAFFCHPDNDTEIACLETCTQQQSPIYPPILAGEYLVSRLQATY
jgi:isopenicillin N synthase-like dioxygenase